MANWHVVPYVNAVGGHSHAYWPSPCMLFEMQMQPVDAQEIIMKCLTFEKCVVWKHALNVTTSVGGFQESFPAKHLADYGF